MIAVRIQLNKIVSNEVAAAAKSLQSCPTLYDPIDGSPPGSSVHGDFLGKNTGLGGHALLRGIFQLRDQTQGSSIAGGFFTS